MANNKITDLRNHLFETIEMLKNGKDERSYENIERARIISQVAQTIINSAKLELQLMKTIDNMSGTDYVVPDFLAPDKTIAKSKN